MEPALRCSRRCFWAASMAAFPLYVAAARCRHPPAVAAGSGGCRPGTPPPLPPSLRLLPSRSARPPCWRRTLPAPAPPPPLLALPPSTVHQAGVATIQELGVVIAPALCSPSSSAAPSPWRAGGCLLRAAAARWLPPRHHAATARAAATAATARCRRTGRGGDAASAAAAARRQTRRPHFRGVGHPAPAIRPAMTVMPSTAAASSAAIVAVSASATEAGRTGACVASDSSLACRARRTELALNFSIRSPWCGERVERQLSRPRCK